MLAGLHRLAAAPQLRGALGRSAPPPRRSRMGRGTTSSTRPSLRALDGFTLLPARIRSSAACAPISRGSRWVPPAPGSRPSCVSGRPSAVFGLSVAIRYWQASAHSSPPPRQAAVDRRHHRLPDRVEPVEALLASREPASASARVFSARENLDLRAGDEAVLLAGDEDHRLHRRVRGRGAVERGVELVGRPRARACSPARPDVERAARPAALARGSRSAAFHGDQRSRTTAAPRPPAAQTVQQNGVLFRRFSSLQRLGDHARAGGGERVPERDRAAVDVEPLAVHLAQRPARPSLLARTPSRRTPGGSRRPARRRPRASRRGRCRQLEPGAVERHAARRRPGPAAAGRRDRRRRRRRSGGTPSGS